METSSRTAFSRLTVLAPRVRVDVALPSDVALTDLMPNLFDLTRVTAGDGGAAHGGWCLSRIGEPELDASKSLAALDVLDGELLHLRPRQEALPAPIYDEIVDAIAAAAAESSRRWDRRLGHHLGLIVAGIALAGTAFALLTLPAVGTAVQIALGLAVLLVATGAFVARAGGDRPTAVLLGAAAVPMAVVAGLRVVPSGGGLFDADNYLVGGTAMLVTSARALVALGTGGAVFTAGATVGLLAAVSALLATFLPSVPVASFAAGLIVVACTAMLFVPRLGTRLAALPMPLVPTSASDFVDDADPDFAEVMRRTRTAEHYLTGLYAGLAVVLAGSAALLALTGGLWAWLLVLVALSVGMLRARGLSRTPHVLALMLPTLAAGLFSLAVLAGDLFRSGSTWTAVGAAGVAAVALAIGVVIPQRRFAPTSKRLLDIAEALLITALLPLALAVMDLYSVFRHL